MCKTLSECIRAKCCEPTDLVFSSSLLEGPEALPRVLPGETALGARRPPLILAEVRERVAVGAAHARLCGVARSPLLSLLQDGLAHAPQHDVGGRLGVGGDAATNRTLPRLPLLPETQQTRAADAVGAGQQHGVPEHVTTHRAGEVLLRQRGAAGHLTAWFGKGVLKYVSPGPLPFSLSLSSLCPSVLEVSLPISLS